MYVEDSPDNVKALREVAPTIVFTNSTNRDIDDPRADTWEEGGSGRGPTRALEGNPPCEERPISLRPASPSCELEAPLAKSPRESPTVLSVPPR